MANINDVFNSGSSLKAADILGKKVPCTIKTVELKEYEDNGKKDRKLYLTFHGKEKGLVVNKTNATRIAELHGEDYDLWPGKDITLYTCKVDFAGDRVDAIRVFVPDAGVAEEDDIPF